MSFPLTLQECRMTIIKLKVFQSASALHTLLFSLWHTHTHLSESDPIVPSLFRDILSGLMVQINDQPEQKDAHRQIHLQQGTFKSGTIQKHHLLLQSPFSFKSNLKKSHFQFWIRSLTLKIFLSFTHCITLGSERINLILILQSNLRQKY